LREGDGTAFVVLSVKPDDPPSYNRNLARLRTASASAARCSGSVRWAATDNSARASANAFGVSPG